MTPVQITLVVACLVMQVVSYLLLARVMARHGLPRWHAWFGVIALLELAVAKRRAARLSP